MARPAPWEHRDGCGSRGGCGGGHGAREGGDDPPIPAIRSCGFATVFHFGTKKKIIKKNKLNQTHQVTAIAAGRWVLQHPGAVTHGRRRPRGPPAPSAPAPARDGDGRRTVLEGGRELGTGARHAARNRPSQNHEELQPNQGSKATP